jgi:hypothetical protein
VLGDDARMRCLHHDIAHLDEEGPPAQVFTARPAAVYKSGHGGQVQNLLTSSGEIRMKKRLLAGLVAVALAGGMTVGLAGPAQSDGPPAPPPHAHLHLTGVVLDETGDWPVSIRKCKPLAAGRFVPNNAHHANLHTGRAGEAQWQAGNAVVPIFLGEDGTPWTDCASLMEFFFGPQ